MQNSGRHFSEQGWPRIGAFFPEQKQIPAPDRPRKLLDQVRDVLRVNHYSFRTDEAYVAWMRRFILFHGKKHPREMGAWEVERFLTHLAVQGKVVAPTQNQALSALLFLYEQVLKKEIGWLAEGIKVRFG